LAKKRSTSDTRPLDLGAIPVTPAQRWRFASDHDAHNYLIKEEDVNAFEEWLASYDEDADPEDEYDGKDFDECRINSEHDYSFTDPRQDG
jgi:hypothetical protein